MRRATRRVTLGLMIAACGGADTGTTGTGGGETESGETDTSATTSDEPTTGTGSGSAGTTETSATDDTMSTDPATSDASATTGAPTDTDSTDTGDEPVYPVPDWDVEPPAEHGLDPDALEEAAMIAAEYNSNCLVITRHGVIVGEWYWNGWDEDAQGLVFSVTKSFTSAMFGIAQGDGELDVDEPASNYIDEWVGTDSEAVTVRQLLSNSSGRHWDFTSDYLTMSFNDDRTQYAIELDQQHPPDTWWEYNNAAIQTLDRVYRVATGVDLGAHANVVLFDRLGMDASFSYDESGNTITYAALLSSCRDLARFGYLYLRGGVWAGGEEVVPPAWVEASLTASTPFNDAYGYLWWLNQDGHYVRPSTPLREEGDGLLIPDAPEGAFTARGLKSQLVAVDPGTELVFTRIVDVPVNDLIFSTPVEGELWAQIMAAVVE